MAFFERKTKKSTSTHRRSLVSACALCCTTKTDDKRSKNTERPTPIPVSGNGDKKILLIRDQPTNHNNLSQNWFARSGRTLSLIGNALVNADIEPEQDCWMTGAVLCHGKKQTTAAMECCLPNLNRTIQQLRPKLIIPIGELATHAVLSFLWHDNSLGDMFRFFGWQIPVEKWNAWLCPVYDSAYIMSLGYKNQSNTDTPTGTGVVAYFWLEKHIKAAVAKLNESPIADVTQKESTQLLYDAETINETLDRISNYNKGYAVFDYEANCLKPEVEGAKVLCASVCLGGWNKVWKSIAFPMSSDVVPAWKRFLQSPIAKVAQNCKFEDRWSNVYFKTPVNNWVGDTLLNTHILDCRGGITGLKFQTAVNFGVMGYDDATKPYMEGGVGKLNRLHLVPVEILLRYCGCDTFYTWRLFVKQMREFGQKPYWE
ncbi:MAG: hypothetical protein LBC02_01050 [Planctomycetaceae bacterium]|jgi:uracil-DNA glycosylase family 4|nr:hypothetical protein [Planctomycetaceae bacterium]